MFVTDITNCYSSIYTHTIAWALMGKERAKEKKTKQRLVREYYRPLYTRYATWSDKWHSSRKYII